MAAGLFGRIFAAALFSAFGAAGAFGFTGVGGTVSSLCGVGIRGILVTLTKDGAVCASTTTDAGGGYTLALPVPDVSSRYTLEFRDIDGGANGRYRPHGFDLLFQYAGQRLTEDVLLEDIPS